MKKQSHPQPSKIVIREWLEASIKGEDRPLTQKDVIKLIGRCLMEKNNKIKKQQDERTMAPTFDELLSTNEHFYECLRQLSDNLLHFAYSPQFRKIGFPNNLIGYYQLIKNIVHVEEVPPKPIKLYLQDHFFRLIFMEFSIVELKINLMRYEGSIMLNLFMKELNQLIKIRIKAFETIYGLAFTDQAEQSIRNYLFDSGAKSNIFMNPSIDDLLLCLTYACFKFKQQKVLFGRICEAYEAEFKTKMKEGFLKFYNECYVPENQEKILNGVMDKIKMDKAVSRAFMGERIEQEKSIFDMFS